MTQTTAGRSRWRFLYRTKDKCDHDTYVWECLPLDLQYVQTVESFWANARR